MRWRRAVLFLFIIAAHVLIIWLFPTGQRREEKPAEEIFFASLTLSVPARHEAAAIKPSISPSAPRTRGGTRAQYSKSRAGARSEPRTASSIPATQAVAPVGSAPAFIDWVAQMQAVGADEIQGDVNRERQATVLSSWKSKIVKSPALPAALPFSWEFAATHKLQSTPQGLYVNLNDRCSLLISLYMMAVMGGCKIGEIPVRGDLFDHMRDDPASSAPAIR